MLLTCKYVDQLASRICEGLFYDFVNGRWEEKVDNEKVWIPVDKETRRTYIWKATNGNVYMTDELSKVPNKYVKTGKYSAYYLPKLYQALEDYMTQKFPGYPHVASGEANECAFKFLTENGGEKMKEFFPFFYEKI